MPPKRHSPRPAPSPQEAEARRRAAQAEAEAERARRREAQQLREQQRQAEAARVQEEARRRYKEQADQKRRGEEEERAKEEAERKRAEEQRPEEDGGGAAERLLGGDVEEDSGEMEMQPLVAPTPRGGHMNVRADGSAETSRDYGADSERAAPPTLMSEICPQIKLSIPMAASQLVDGLTQQVSIMMIGHLGPEMLGAAVLATM